MKVYRHFMCVRIEAINNGDYVVTADRMGLGRVIYQSRSDGTKIEVHHDQTDWLLLLDLGLLCNDYDTGRQVDNM